jgi:hypothetical protein
MAYTNQLFVAFCKKVAKLPTVYMWGTYGDVVSESLIQRKKKQYPNNYSDSRVSKLRTKVGNTYGCDCSGLIKWFLMTDGGKTLKPKYQSKYDLGTSGLYSKATTKGKIATLPELPGVAVWKNGHVGVYVGNGKVIECTLSSRGDGVVYSNLKDYGWTHWLKIPGITYVEAKKSTIDIANEVIQGKWGNGAERKQRLTAAGYNYTTIQKQVNKLLQ